MQMLSQHRAFSLTALALVLLLLPGCLTFSSIINLRADGSGTIEERMTLSPQIAAMMQGMAAAADTTGDGSSELFSEEEVRQRADEMGGVRFVDMEPVSGPDGQGYVATFAFDDINEVTFSQNPSGAMPEGMQDQAGAAGTDASAFRFEFTPGAPATLSIILPEPDEEEATAGASGEAMTSADSSAMAAQLQMMRGMLSGMHMHMALEVEGTITETNATHRTGNRITLFEMDMNKLMDDAEPFRAFMMSSQSGSADPSQLRQLADETDGITMEEQETVTVRFN